MNKPMQPPHKKLFKIVFQKVNEQQRGKKREREREGLKTKAVYYFIMAFCKTYVQQHHNACKQVCNV